MAVRVKHDVGGGDISALVRLAAAAGAAQAQAPELPKFPQIPGGTSFGGGGGGGGTRRSGGGMSSRDRFAMQANELTAARDMQKQKIDAQAERDKQSAEEAMNRMAVAHGLGEEMKNQEYDREVKMMQEQAKADAKQFKWEISEQDKRELTKINNARSSLKKARDRNEFSPEEFERADRELALMEMGIEPSRRPAVDEPPPAQERIFRIPGRPGEYTDDGRGSVRAVLPPQYDTQYLQEKAKIDAESKQAVAVSKYEDTLWALEDEDERGNPKQRYSRAQIRAKVNERFPGTYEMAEEEQREVVQARLAGKYDYAPEEELPPAPPGRPAPAGQPMLPDREAETRAAITGVGEGAWWGALESQGVAVSEERRQMPLEKGSALSLYDAYMQKFGSFENVPEELKPALAEIIKTVRKHRGK